MSCNTCSSLALTLSNSLRVWRSRWTCAQSSFVSVSSLPRHTTITQNGAFSISISGRLSKPWWPASLPINYSSPCSKDAVSAMSLTCLEVTLNLCTSPISWSTPIWNLLTKNIDCLSCRLASRDRATGFWSWSRSEQQSDRHWWCRLLKTAGVHSAFSWWLGIFLRSNCAAPVNA